MFSGVGPVDFSGMFTIKFFVDLADMSRMDLWVSGSNAGMTYSNNTGTATFDTTNTLIRIGQNYIPMVDSSCYISNVRLQPFEFWEVMCGYTFSDDRKCQGSLW